MSNSDSIYNAIKALEASFPIPAPSGTFVVGIFDADTGRFSYNTQVVQSYSFLVNPNSLNPAKGSTPPVIVTGGNVVAFNTVNVSLTFKVVNAKGAKFAVHLGDKTFAADTDPTSVTIDVEMATSAGEFTLSCGKAQFTSQAPLKISRPLYGAGAFMIPALPIAIVYAPPVATSNAPGSAGPNNVMVSLSKFNGTTTSISFSIQNTIQPPLYGSAQSVANIQSYARLAAKGAALIPEVGAAISGALNLFASSLDTHDPSETDGSEITNENTLVVWVADTTSVTTDPNLGGPPLGDKFITLVNVRLVWFMDNGKLNLALIGWDELATYNGMDLVLGNTSFDDKTNKALLNLDPFYTNEPLPSASAPLTPGQRLTHVTSYEVSTGLLNRTSEHTASQSDTQSRVSTQIITADSGDFLPAYFSVNGLTDLDDIVQATLTQGNSSQTTSGATITSSVNFSAGTGTNYIVDVYYDAIFATFAYQLAQQQKVPWGESASTS